MAKKSRPLILLSNDDGYRAKGINELMYILGEVADLIVVAPDGPRSGAGASITSETPLRYELVSEREGLTIYKCNGTPVDCVKLGLDTIVPRRPDLVIGGINHGDNSSVNVHYSGTMGVVIEGCLKGIPSIGFSLCDHSADAYFTGCFPYILRIVSEVLEKGLPYGTCLNVNFPLAESFKGIRICRQTDGVWTQEFESCPHPKRENYYWLTGVYKNNEPEAKDTDHWALDHGYVAITPTTIDVTDYQLKQEMNHWNWEV